MSDSHTHTHLSTMSTTRTRKFVSLGLFIIDEFAFADAAGKPTGRSLSPQGWVSFITPRPSTSGLFVASTFPRLAAEALMLPLAPACGKGVFLLPVGFIYLYLSL